MLRTNTPPLQAQFRFYLKLSAGKLCRKVTVAVSWSSSFAQSKALLDG